MGVYIASHVTPIGWVGDALLIIGTTMMTVSLIEMTGDAISAYQAKKQLEGVLLETRAYMFEQCFTIDEGNDLVSFKRMSETEVDNRIEDALKNVYK